MKPLDVTLWVDYAEAQSDTTGLKILRTLLDGEPTKLAVKRGNRWHPIRELKLQVVTVKR